MSGISRYARHAVAMVLAGCLMAPGFAIGSVYCVCPDGETVLVSGGDGCCRAGTGTTPAPDSGAVAADASSGLGQCEAVCERSHIALAALSPCVKQLDLDSSASIGDLPQPMPCAFGSALVESNSRPHESLAVIRTTVLRR